MAPEHAEHDTGVKLTAFLVINKDTKADSQYGQITLREMPQVVGGTPGKSESFSLRNNSLIMIKSRRVQYEIKANSQKVFVVCMKIAGPRAELF